MSSTLIFLLDEPNSVKIPVASKSVIPEAEVILIKTGKLVNVPLGAPEIVRVNELANSPAVEAELDELLTLELLELDELSELLELDELELDDSLELELDELELSELELLDN